MWILDQERFLIQQCYRNLSVVPERSRTRRQFPQTFLCTTGCSSVVKPASIPRDISSRLLLKTDTGFREQAEVPSDCVRHSGCSVLRLQSQTERTATRRHRLMKTTQ